MKYDNLKGIYDTYLMYKKPLERFLLSKYYKPGNGDSQFNFFGETRSNDSKSANRTDNYLINSVLK